MNEPCHVQARARVLVVDDDESSRLALAMALSDALEVACARDGNEALAQMSRDSFDAVISDVSMPGLSGPALRERIARLDEGLAARTVFVTGDPDNSELQAALAGRPGRVLPKPINTTALRALLATLVELSPRTRRR